MTVFNKTKGVGVQVTGILHAHSTHSYDGKVPLPELKELCKKEGISFVCMTEHTDTLTSETAEAFVRECEALSDDSFLFIPGFELPYKPAGAREAAHILLFGCRAFWGQFAPDAAALRAAASGAACVILAHPVRNDFIIDEVMQSVLDGVEIWNQQYEGKRVPRPRAYRLLEEVRSTKPNAIAIGGLDLHRTEHLTFPRTTLELDALSEKEIIGKIKAGDFSFSSPLCTVSGNEVWHDNSSFVVRMRSVLSIAIIVAGKTVNKLLAMLGIRLPKEVVRAIRSKV